MINLYKSHIIKTYFIKEDVVMTKRVYNFSAGPSTLPVSVLENIASQMLNYHDSGMSVMEMSPILKSLMKQKLC